MDNEIENLINSIDDQIIKNIIKSQVEKYSLTLDEIEGTISTLHFAKQDLDVYPMRFPLSKMWKPTLDNNFNYDKWGPGKLIWLNEADAHILLCLTEDGKRGFWTANVPIDLFVKYTDNKYTNYKENPYFEYFILPEDDMKIIFR